MGYLIVVLGLACVAGSLTERRKESPRRWLANALLMIGILLVVVGILGEVTSHR